MVIHIHGVPSFVYNLRIAETTKRGILEQQDKPPYVITTTVVGQFRKKYDGAHQTIGGGMGSFVCSSPSLYFRVDLAGAHVANKKDGVSLSRSQLDDLLITSGVKNSLNEHIIFTLSGLLGIPLHKDTSLTCPQLGYGHVSLGAQLDGSFILSADKMHSLRPAIRLIHFFPRNAHINTQSYIFNFGNLLDVFLGYHLNGLNYRTEVGYDLTVLSHAKIRPYVANIMAQTDYVRNSFYGSYKYRFLLCKLPSAVTFALSYGFDATPKKFGYKSIVTIWGSWEINF